MAAACADQSRFGVAKQLLGFGSEIGIDLDDIPDIEEANRRMQQIVEAWNAQPDDVRLARSSTWQGAGTPLDFGTEPGLPDKTAALPDSPLFEFDQEGNLILPDPPDLEASAAQAQESAFVQHMLALAEWVSDGREITSTDTLRPAVGRQAYHDLRLEVWQRKAMRGRFARLYAGAEFAVQEPPSWRSSAECFALERLWRPALSAGLITTAGKRARFDRSAIPTSPEEWLRLALIGTVSLLTGWNDGESVDLAIEVLTATDLEHGEPTRPDDRAEHWWHSANNTWRLEPPFHDEDEEFEEDAAGSSIGDEGPRALSDDELDSWLAVFADHGLWKEQEGRLIGTELGRDLLIILVRTWYEDLP